MNGIYYSLANSMYAVCDFKAYHGDPVFGFYDWWPIKEETLNYYYTPLFLLGDEE